MGASLGGAPPVQQSLRDMVLGMLSIAAVEGRTRVPLTEFSGAFEAVVEKHRDMFPPMRFTKNADSVYSKRLDEALQSFIGGSIDVPNPQLQFLQVEKAAARRHLAWLRDKYGTGAVDSLKPLTKEFLARLSSPDGR
jgi:hypothetical protein